MNHPIENGEIHIRTTGKESYGRAIFALDHPYHYISKDNKIDVTVPKGFETDFASIPFVFWWLFPPAGEWQKSAVVHDYLYRSKLTSRRIADSVFLKEKHLAPIRMFLIWAGVRLFGWLFYYRKWNNEKRN